MRGIKLEIDLGTARQNEVLARDVYAVTILDKGTGNFTLTLHFLDGSEMQLTEDEVLNGDVLYYDQTALFLTNSAQSGKTLKLIIDKKLEL
jgi:hypothetical protein